MPKKYVRIERFRSAIIIFPYNFEIFRFYPIFAPANVEGFGLIATTIKKC